LFPQSHRSRLAITVAVIRRTQKSITLAAARKVRGTKEKMLYAIEICNWDGIALQALLEEKYQNVWLHRTTVALPLQFG